MEELAAEPVDDPQEKGEDDAEQDGGCEGNGDRPSAATPGKIAGETTEREMEAGEAKNDESGDDQQEAKEEECATEVRHIDSGRKEVRQWQAGLRLRGEALQAGRVS
jgi:hypothetical protein